nr:hypothetical protein [uncultured Peptoniphilus sp.]
MRVLQEITVSAPTVKGQLRARVSPAFYSAKHGVQTAETLAKDLESLQNISFNDTDWIDCLTVKLFCDAVQMSYTAWMNDDYADRSNFKGRSVFGGDLATEKEQIREMDGMVKLAHDAGYQLPFMQ